MISFLIKVIFYLVVFMALFLGLNWVLLGMAPMESWERFQSQIGNLSGRTEVLPEQMEDMTQDMIQSAGQQVQETAENLNETISRQANELSGDL